MDLDSKGLISWFARNPVAANLVMVLVFFAGTLSLLNMSKEIFPRTETRVISIGAVSYTHLTLPTTPYV